MLGHVFIYICPYLFILRWLGRCLWAGLKRVLSLRVSGKAGAFALALCVMVFCVTPVCAVNPTAVTPLIGTTLSKPGTDLVLAMTEASEALVLNLLTHVKDRPADVLSILHHHCNPATVSSELQFISGAALQTGSFKELREVSLNGSHPPVAVRVQGPGEKTGQLIVNNYERDIMNNVARCWEKMLRARDRGYHFVKVMLVHVYNMENNPAALVPLAEFIVGKRKAWKADWDVQYQRAREVVVKVRELVGVNAKIEEKAYWNSNEGPRDRLLRRGAVALVVEQDIDKGKSFFPNITNLTVRISANGVRMAGLPSVPLLAGQMPPKLARVATGGLQVRAGAGRHILLDLFPQAQKDVRDLGNLKPANPSELWRITVEQRYGDDDKIKEPERARSSRAAAKNGASMSDPAKAKAATKEQMDKVRAFLAERYTYTAPEVAEGHEHGAGGKKRGKGGESKKKKAKTEL